MNHSTARRWIWLILPVLLLAVGCQKGESKDAPDKTRDVSRPVTLPDVPLYPSGKVIERAYADDGSFQVRLLTPAGISDIEGFYTKRLTPYGWKQIAEVRENEYMSIYAKRGKRLIVSVFPTDNPDEMLHVLNYRVR